MPIRRPDFSRRVAVTGLGIISPIGQDKDTAWDNLVNGRSGLQDDHPLGSLALRGADRRARSTTSTARKWMDFKAIRRTDRNVVMGVASAKQALADSGLEVDRRQPRRHRRHLRLGRRRAVPADGEPGEVGDQRVRARSSPFFIANMLPDTASGQIAIETGIRGSNMCIVTACSTGTHNIGEAAEGIRRGDYIAAITGATENPLHEMVYIGFIEHARHGHAPAG